MKTLDILNSGLVTRWHTNTQMNYTRQNNAAHSWGVCILAQSLAPELATKDFIINALFHDCGEMNTFDMPSPAKSRMPELSDILRTEEAFQIKELGIELPELTPDQQKFLKLCDLVEALLFIMKSAIYPNEVVGVEECIDKISALCGSISQKGSDDIWYWLDANVNPILVDRGITNKYKEMLQILPF